MIINVGSPNRPVAYPEFLGLSWVSKSELDWLIDKLPEAGFFIEIGTASGVTAAKIADARPGATVICVDIYEDHDSPWVADNEESRIDNWRANKRPNMHLWFGDIESFAQIVCCPIATVVIVDGSHKSPQVSLDLRIAIRLLVDGGLLFVHDYYEPALPEVKASTDKFCGEYGFEVVESHWTIVLLGRV